METKIPNTDKTLRVLFLVAEADPFIRVGGLGDVGGALPKSLLNLSPEQTHGYELDVRLVLPLHPDIDQKTLGIKPLLTSSIPSIDGHIPFQAYQTDLTGFPVYLVAGAPIDVAGSVYTRNPLLDGEKFTFFSLASLELARQLDWSPHVIHANDWHTALSLYQLSRIKHTDPFFSSCSSLISVHNLPFMGNGAELAMRKYGIHPSINPQLPEWARNLPLPLGLQSADQIVAVSPGYAKEILTPEFGCGLEEFFKTKQDSISGILNGLDLERWDPSTDRSLSQNYSSVDLSQRLANKTDLQRQLNLQEDVALPLLILVGRLELQKGVDLVFEALPHLTGMDWQLIILGTGDPTLEEAALSLESKFPNRVRTLIRFDSKLSRQMYAGGDIILMPSRYEPCGLAQMIAMRYGCVPLARATGGLQDTIKDISLIEDSTGFLFKSANSQDLIPAVQRAFTVYRDTPLWRKIQQNGMALDFSWKRSAAAYANIYASLREKSL